MLLAASAAGVCQACKDPRFKKNANAARAHGDVVCPLPPSSLTEANLTQQTAHDDPAAETAFSDPSQDIARLRDDHFMAASCKYNSACYSFDRCCRACCPACCRASMGAISRRMSSEMSMPLFHVAMYSSPSATLWSLQCVQQAGWSNLNVPSRHAGTTVRVTHFTPGRDQHPPHVHICTSALAVSLMHLSAHPAAWRCAKHLSHTARLGSNTGAADPACQPPPPPAAAAHLACSITLLVPTSASDGLQASVAASWRAAAMSAC